jgi:hypothetical protein
VENLALGFDLAQLIELAFAAAGADFTGFFPGFLGLEI